MNNDLLVPWLEVFSSQPEIVEDQLGMVYSILNKMLLKAGHLGAFIELAEDLIPRVQALTTLNPFFTSELLVYL